MQGTKGREGDKAIQAGGKCKMGAVQKSAVKGEGERRGLGLELT